MKCRHHMSHMLNHFHREVRHFTFLYSWFQVVARLTQLWHNTTADTTAPVLPAQIPPAHKYPISRSIPPAHNLVYRPRSSRTFYTISLQPHPSPSHPNTHFQARRVRSSSCLKLIPIVSPILTLSAFFIGLSEVLVSSGTCCFSQLVISPRKSCFS